MAYRTRIKAAGVNNLTNARFFASYQVDWIGLDMDPLSPNGLTVDQVKEIMQWLAHPQLAAEFTNRSSDEAAFLCKELGLKGAQIPYEQSGIPLQSENLFVWKYLSLEDGMLPMGLLESDANGFVLDVGRVDSLEQIDDATQQFLDEACSGHDVWLRVEASQPVLNQLLGRFELTGIDLRIGDELSPGLQEFTATLDLLESLFADN